MVVIVPMRIEDMANEGASLISRRCWSDPRVYALEKVAIFGGTEVQGYLREIQAQAAERLGD